MGIDDPEGRVLFLQVLDQSRQDDMLEHIGEVSGVEGVGVVHTERFQEKCEAVFRFGSATNMINAGPAR